MGSLRGQVKISYSVEFTGEPGLGSARGRRVALLALALGLLTVAGFLVALREPIALWWEVRSEGRLPALVRLAARSHRLGKRARALDACRRILVLEPGNRRAESWVRALAAGPGGARSDRPQDVEAAVPDSSIFFPARGESGLYSLHRDALVVALAEDPEWRARIAQRLETLITFAFEDRPLDDILACFGDSTGVQFSHDPGIAGATYRLNMQAKEMPAVDALAQVLTLCGLACTAQDGRIHVFRVLE